MYKKKYSVTSPVNEKADQSSDPCSTSTSVPNSNATPHKKSTLLTPCRSVGLKRKSMKPQLRYDSDHILTANITGSSSSRLGLQAPLPPINALKSPHKSENDASNTPVKSVKRIKKYVNVVAKQDSQSYIEELKKRVKEKQIKLSSYLLDPKKKESLELQAETVVWRKACQLALEDLMVHVHAEGCNSSNKNNLDMVQLLHHLNIPASLVSYDVDNQEFQ